MVVFEALNALYGDCLLLRFTAEGGGERLWIVDGGPKADKANGATGKIISTWKDVLLPRIQQIGGSAPREVSLGMVSHIDDDHINGIQRVTDLLRNTPTARSPIQFGRFWFNSFDDLVGPATTAMSGGVRQGPQTAAVVTPLVEEIQDEIGQAVVQSVPEGMALASDLIALGLNGNKPIGGLVVARTGAKPVKVDEALVTVLGPTQKRLDKLHKEWAKAVAKTDKKARTSTLLDLLGNVALDNAVPNLSSIVVLVDVGGRKLLLTGDARGDDIVKAWTGELALGKGPVAVDLVKMPHHGSERNNTPDFIAFFEAKHYVFSANGKFENPDPPVVEAVVAIHGHRPMTMWFTNGAIAWSKPYKLDKNGALVSTLPDLLAALREAYGGNWKAASRQDDKLSLEIEL